MTTHRLKGHLIVHKGETGSVIDVGKEEGKNEEKKVKEVDLDKYPR